MYFLLRPHITHTHTHRSDTTCTHTEQSLAHLAALFADMLQQGLQGLQETVAVVVAPGAGCTLARSCRNTIERGGIWSELVQELLHV